MYIKDFVKEFQKLQIPLDKSEMEEMYKLADSTGKVCFYVLNKFTFF